LDVHQHNETEELIMKRLKSLMVIGMALVTMTVFTACSSGSDETAKETADNTTESTTEETISEESATEEVTTEELVTELEESVASDDTIAKIKEAGVLKVATGTYVPFEYRDETTNEIVGFDIDFAQILADKLGVKLEVTDMAFASIVPCIEKGEYDLAIAAMYDTEARREVVLMSDSYMETGMVLVTQAGNEKGITSLADCEGLKVGVKAGATSQTVAEEAMAEYGIEYEIVGYEETVGCITDLSAGRVDVVVNDLLNQMELNKVYEDVEIVCDPFTQADLSIAVMKGNDGLLEFINEVIAEYKEDGTYDELYKTWIE